MEHRPPAPLDQDELRDVIAPFGRSRMPPRAAYVDPGVLEWEQRWFFDGGWVCAGRARELAEPGDVRAVKLGTTGVVLARGHDGGLRAFANVCRHRGHELLACDTSGHRSVLQCPYHAWSYELDGSLRVAPRFDAEGFDPAAFGLLDLALAEWGGWVFVNVSGEAPAFPEHLGTLGEIVAPYECDRLVAVARHTYHLAANWKLAHENYQECYHCPLIHPELCRVSPPTSGRNLVDRRGAWVGGAMDLVTGATTMSFDGRSGGQPLRGLDDRQRREVVYVSLFPSLLLSLHPDYVMTHRLRPVSPAETAVECEWLFPPEVAAAPGFDPAYAVSFWDLTNRQDWAAVESVQRGLASPAFVPGVLAPQEDAVYQLVTMVARGYLGLPLEPQVGSN